MLFRCAARYAALVFLSVCALFAQNTGRLSGTVTDSSGLAIPNAKVDLYLPGGNAPVLSTTTSSGGLFSFSGIQPVTYDLVIDQSGFVRHNLRGVKVNPAQETSVPSIQLQVASVQQTIEVAAENPVIKINESEISTTITQDQVRRLPVLDRQVSNLFLTQPGVSSGRGPTTINGLRTANVNLTLDGVNVQDNYIRANALDYVPGKFTIEQVSELTIATSNQNASFGLGASQIAMVTPSGSNRFHGSLYEYNRNSYFAANDYFNNQTGTDKPFLNQNQFGGSLGGPILKDKLLFYTNYELFRLRRQALVTRTILTPDARQGFFSYVDAGGTLRRVNVLGLRGAQIDPAIQSRLNQLPANGNSFDAGDSSPGQLLNTTGYAFNSAYNNDRKALTTRIDYILSPRHSINGSFVYNTDKVDRPDLTNDFDPTTSVFNDNYSKLMSLAWRWNIAPSLTNEVRGGFNIAPGTFNIKNAPPDFFAGELLFDDPVSQYERQGRYSDTYTFQDNANWLKGRHNIFFGFQSQLLRIRSYAYTGTTPVYNLNISTENTNGLTEEDLPGIGATDLANANSLYANLAGVISGYTRTFNVTGRDSGYVAGAPFTQRWQYDTYSGYFQDNWKIRPRLNINIGLRYDYYTPVTERDSLTLLPELANGNFINSLLTTNNQLSFAGTSAGRPYYKKDLNNFAPNIGFAWDVFGTGRTSVRGAYTISYVNDETLKAIINSVTTNAGLSTQTTNDVGLVGRLTGGVPTIPTPTFQVPITYEDQYNLAPAAAALSIPDPNLRTPYVQQYSFGVEHEVARNTTVSVRYVGNHSTKLLRAIDYNQVNINASGFLQDFRRAQRNGFLALQQTGVFRAAYNPNIAGSQQLPVFAQLGSGGLLTNATISNLIRTGQVGSLAATYQQNGLNGDVNFFPNPFTNGANAVVNYSNASYNSLQVDVVRRFSTGSQLQFNYVFSKALTDAGLAADTQNRFEPFLDNNNPRLERGRAPFDLTHVFKTNYVLDLPYGAGRRFTATGWKDRIFGGWTTSGFLVYQSGAPFSILSTRGTLNRAGLRSQQNTAVSLLNGDELKDLVGLFRTPNGLYFINPSAIGPDGRGVAADGSAPFPGQVFYNPDPGTVGSLQRRYFSGPWTFNWDASVLKRVNITERQFVEFRAEAFNILNHPAFYAGDENIDVTPFNINSTQFGKITSTTGTFNGFRRFQFGLYYRF